MEKKKRTHEKLQFVKSLHSLSNVITTLLGIVSCIWANSQLMYLLQNSRKDVFLYIFCIGIDIFYALYLASFMKKIIKKLWEKLYEMT